MQENEKINKIVSFLVDNYDLESFELPSEYDYSCLPLCILDAVFSIGVKYKSVENVISRFCAKTGVLKYRDPSTEEYTVSAFCDYIDTTGVEAFENDILENHQRTSSKMVSRRQKRFGKWQNYCGKTELIQKLILIRK